MKIECRKSNIHGYGIFAREFIPAGELIERCPIIRIEQADFSYLSKTTLQKYLFDWSSPSSFAAAFVMGYGMVYNHSYTPNAMNKKNWQESSMDHFAIKDIQIGEEITLNYGGEPNSKLEMWF
jgi:SET domain-containing protein